MLNVRDVATPPALEERRSWAFSIEGSVLYVVIGGLILGVVGVWTAVTHHPSPWLVARYVAVGVVYLGVGYWLSSKGYGALGILVALTGALWFIPELQDTRRGMLVGLAILFEDAFRATYAHAVLAYPRGRIRPRLGAWVVGAGYLLVLGGGPARALTFQPYIWESCDCPRNGFSIWHSESVYNAVNDPYRLVGLILAIALIALLVWKSRTGASGQEVDRRPIWAALLGSVLILVSGIIRDQLDLSRTGLILWLWVEGIGMLAVALSFLLLNRRRIEAAQL